MFKFILIFLLKVQLLEFFSDIMNVQANNGSVLSTPSTPVKRQGQENVKVKIFSVCFIMFCIY